MYAIAERDDRRFSMPVENYEEISFVCANPACTKVNAEGETVRCTSIRFTSFWQTVKLGEDGANNDDSEEESVTQEEFNVPDLDVPNVVAVEVQAPRPQGRRTALAIEVPAPTSRRSRRHRKPSARVVANVTASTVSSRAKRRRT